VLLCFYLAYRLPRSALNGLEIPRISRVTDRFELDFKLQVRLAVELLASSSNKGLEQQLADAQTQVGSIHFANPKDL
jgi:hypothetical protein